LALYHVSISPPRRPPPSTPCPYTRSSDLERAQPHLVAAAGDGEDVVTLELRMGRLAEMAEPGAGLVHHAHAAALGRHPDAVASVHVQRLDQVARKRGRVLGIVLPDPEADAVIARQAVPGRDPQVAFLGARDRRDRGRRQPVPRPEDAEARHLRHRGAQCTGQRQKEAQPDQPHGVLVVNPGANRRNARCPAQAARPPACLECRRWPCSPTASAAPSPPRWRGRRCLPPAPRRPNRPATPWTRSTPVCCSRCPTPASPRRWARCPAARAAWSSTPGTGAAPAWTCACPCSGWTWATRTGTAPPWPAACSMPGAGRRRGSYPSGSNRWDRTASSCTAC